MIRPAAFGLAVLAMAACRSSIREKVEEEVNQSESGAARASTGVGQGSVIAKKKAALECDVVFNAEGAVIGEWLKIILDRSPVGTGESTSVHLPTCAPPVEPAAAVGKVLCNQGNRGTSGVVKILYARFLEQRCSLDSGRNKEADRAFTFEGCRSGHFEQLQTDEDVQLVISKLP